MFPKPIVETNRMNSLIASQHARINTNTTFEHERGAYTDVYRVVKMMKNNKVQVELVHSECERFVEHGPPHITRSVPSQPITRILTFKPLDENVKKGFTPNIEGFWMSKGEQFYIG